MRMPVFRWNAFLVPLVGFVAVFPVMTFLNAACKGQLALQDNQSRGNLPLGTYNGHLCDDCYFQGMFQSRMIPAFVLYTEPTILSRLWRLKTTSPALPQGWMLARMDAWHP